LVEAAGLIKKQRMTDPMNQVLLLFVAPSGP
jgi:hypothetical protein